MKAILFAATATLLLVACGKADQPVENESAGVQADAETQSASARPAEFQQCAICHSDKKDGPRRTGPTLFGIMETKAGTVPADFAFSEAMKKSDIVWTRETLDAFIEKPSATVPGTRMIFMGVKDPAHRTAIIDYLETLKEAP